MANLNWYVAADMTDFTPEPVGDPRVRYRDEDTIVSVSGRDRYEYFGDFDYPSAGGIEGTLTGFRGVERGALTVTARGLEIDIQRFAFGDPQWVQRKLLAGDDLVRGSVFDDALVADRPRAPS